ncbi:MAG: hypothetical protein U0835_08210 [Isosphaeraceae bacterium]
MPRTALIPVMLGLFYLGASLHAAEPKPIDRSGFQEGGQVAARVDGEALSLSWPAGDGRSARLDLNLRPGQPLIRGFGIAAGPGDPLAVRDVDPVLFVTVGSRENPPGRPPGMSVFNVFFDNPANRPHQTFEARFSPRTARLSGGKARATVAFDGLTAGAFSGTLELSVYAGSPLLRVEGVLATAEDRRAFTYDAGLVARSPSWVRLVWRDTEGKVARADHRPGVSDTSLAVRHRALAVEGPNGSVAAFPPPHQFFYPRDLTDNQSTVWHGVGHRGLEPREGFGVRQTERGGGNFVPWFNAPPGTAQRMGVFYLADAGDGQAALDRALALTNGDRFPALPGHVRMTSHWHMATAVAAMKKAAAGKSRTTPDLVRMFQDMNIEVVHLAEFHGDGHPQDPGPLRMPELQAMFDECKRLSGFGPLFLPGEEANVHLGVSGPGQHPGHWLYLFPRPVYWTMKRRPGQPFEEKVAGVGKVYHVGDRNDMVRLLREERGLAWTAHPRIKASNWAPDAYRTHDYYLDPLWLGGAWKAMPADLSRPRLGERVLDLLDDMANWGQHKYVLGEVDVFKIDHTHELYGHMNVNYLRLDRVPKYDEDWTPILDALRGGRFFVTTGEVLLYDFKVAGQPSGATLTLPADGRVAVGFVLKGTFPFAFAEVISGDGSKVYRERVDLSETAPFATLLKTLRLDLSGRKWVRVEAWDIAANGCFSQPVWLEPAAK